MFLTAVLLVCTADIGWVNRTGHTGLVKRIDKECLSIQSVKMYSNYYIWICTNGKNSVVIYDYRSTKIEDIYLVRKVVGYNFEIWRLYGSST